MDPLILSRIQFAANISFHILFPSITIALGWVLLFFKLRYNRTGDGAWMRAYFTWVKVFALSFALGVVSGITMSFQFGTNWPGYMGTVGNIAGPLLAYEMLTAFFLEAVFLGIMLFGFRRVSNRVHTLATFLVAFGTTVSAFWILALNSWMQTPAGFEMRDGVAHVVDWWAVIFNPSFPYRLIHMLLASGLTVAVPHRRPVGAALSSPATVRNPCGRRCAPASSSAPPSIPVQIFVGDQHGLNTLEHQPQKIAAMEANWRNRRQRAAGAVRHPRRDRRVKTSSRSPSPTAPAWCCATASTASCPGLDDYPGNHPPVFAGVLGLPHHGRHRPADARRVVDGRLVPVASRHAAAAARLCSWCRWRCPAGSPCWPAGTPPKSAASPGWSPAS